MLTYQVLNSRGLVIVTSHSGLRTPMAVIFFIWPWRWGVSSGIWIGGTAGDMGLLPDFLMGGKLVWIQSRTISSCLCEWTATCLDDPDKEFSHIHMALLFPFFGVRKDFYCFSCSCLWSICLTIYLRSSELWGFWIFCESWVFFFGLRKCRTMFPCQHLTR